MKHIVLLLLSVACYAQQAVVATWIDGRNPAGTTYKVYRSPAGTSDTVTLTPTPIAALTYSDQTPGAGAWCYKITAIVNGAESAPDIGCITVAPFAPTGLTLAPLSLVAASPPGTSGVNVRAFARAPAAKKTKAQPPTHLVLTQWLRKLKP